MKKYKLCNLYRMDSGISTKPEQAGKGTPFLSFKTIFNNSILPEALPDLMKTTKEEQVRYSINSGDIFLTRTSESLDELAMSSVALKNYPNATFSGFAKRLRPIQQNITYDKFMAFYMRSDYFRRIINCKAIMTLRASFNEDIFSYIDIELPEYSQQVKSGDLFWEIEQKIRNNNKINLELESMAKTIYDYWFLQFEFPNEEGKPYKSSGGKLVWNKELGREIPEGWGVGALGDLFESQAGFAFKSKNWRESGHPVLTIKAIDEMGKVDLKCASFIDENFDDRFLKYCVENGNMIFAMSGNTIGKTGIIAFKENNILINQRILIIRTKSNTVTYSYFTLRDKKIQNVIEQLGRNSAQPNISEEQLRGIKICMANKCLIKKYNDMCTTFFKQIIRNQIENQELSSLRDFLLPLLMNGQVGFKENISAKEIEVSSEEVLTSVNRK